MVPKLQTRKDRAFGQKRVNVADYNTCCKLVNVANQQMSQNHTCCNTRIYLTIIPFLDLSLLACQHDWYSFFITFKSTGFLPEVDKKLAKRDGGADDSLQRHSSPIICHRFASVQLTLFAYYPYQQMSYQSETTHKTLSKTRSTFCSRQRKTNQRIKTSLFIESLSDAEYDSVMQASPNITFI